MSAMTVVVDFPSPTLEIRSTNATQRLNVFTGNRVTLLEAHIPTALAIKCQAIKADRSSVSFRPPNEQTPSKSPSGKRARSLTIFVHLEDERLPAGCVALLVRLQLLQPDLLAEEKVVGDHLLRESLVLQQRLRRDLGLVNRGQYGEGLVWSVGRRRREKEKRKENGIKFRTEAASQSPCLRPFNGSRVDR